MMTPLDEMLTDAMRCDAMNTENKREKSSSLLISSLFIVI